MGGAESTRFEFRYGHATRVVEDSGNHMQWVYGGMPDSITVRDGKRLVVCDEPKAIIKSWADSMEANDDDFHHKGYMGIWSDGTHFWVDGGGVVQP